MTVWPIDSQSYIQFLVLMGAMAVSPGPANVFALTIGLEKGWRAGLIGVAGMNAATFVWFLAAALGLGALMSAFPRVFNVLAVLGGLYVAWLGLKALRVALSPSTQGVRFGSGVPATRPFRDGFIVQIANPKVLLFFGAILPPFINPDRAIIPQLVMLGGATFVFDGISMCLFVLAGAALSRQFGQAKFARIFSGSIGALLLVTAALILSRIAS